MEPKKILVAGGAGFIGSHLCDYLIGQGHGVVCIDNLSTGRKENIQHLLKHRNFKFIEMDVVHLHRPGVNFSKFWGGRVDEIYHLASPASPPQYQKNPIGTWQANTIGTVNLLELARRHRAKFLLASTSEVYGDPLVHPQTETYWGNVNPVGIRSCYDESKRAGETVCMDYHRTYGMIVKIVRIFNTYGPRMDKNDGRVVSNFITQALMKRPLTVYGRGKQTRSFQYIADLIIGLVKMMASSKSFIGPVNLGNPKEFTIKELALKVLELTGSKSKIVYKPLPPDDPQQRRPDIALAEKTLHWRPQVSLHTGLKRTIEYFKITLL
ncbi:MAG: SDR family oxidoreductase [Patescibacteria group bacterium]|nr:SDR family oxidoreductase [Patescibacteria group bacterium]